MGEGPQGSWRGLVSLSFFFLKNPLFYSVVHWFICFLNMYLTDCCSLRVGHLISTCGICDSSVLVGILVKSKATYFTYKAIMAICDNECGDDCGPTRA